MLMNEICLSFGILCTSFDFLFYLDALILLISTSIFFITKKNDLSKIAYHLIINCSFFRSGSIIIDFKIVVIDSSKNNSQSDIANKIHDLLSRGVNVTYSGQGYVVDEVTVTDCMEQNTSKHKL